MKMRVTLLCTIALLLTVTAAHEMFPVEVDSSMHEVEATKGRVLHWIHDQFMMVFWIISQVIVLPVGVLATLAGHPKAYNFMYDEVVRGMFKLSGYNATKVY